jgi:hypothetical protein
MPMTPLPWKYKASLKRPIEQRIPYRTGTVVRPNLTRWVENYVLRALRHVRFSPMSDRIAVRHEVTRWAIS